MSRNPPARFRATLPGFCRLVVGLLLLSALAQAPVRAAERASMLAIQGYDPVAYFTMHKAVRGLATLEYEWDEQIYRFVKAEHLAMFKANPGAYAPRFGNLCAMALSKDLTKPANPEYYLVVKGQLFLFGEELGPERFVKDAQALTRAQRNYAAHR